MKPTIDQIRKYIDCTLHSCFEDYGEAIVNDAIGGFKYENTNPDDPVTFRSFCANPPIDNLELTRPNFKTGVDKPRIIGDRCLDFGCGPGIWLRYFAQFYKQVDGCDISSHMVRAADHYLTEHNIPHEIYKVDYESLSQIPDGVYDLIYSTTVFQHIPVYSLRRMYLEQLFDKLKPGGSIGIQIPGHQQYDTNPEAGKISDYFDEEIHTRWTNSRNDITITDPEAVAKDFESIGFKYIDILGHRVRRPKENMTKRYVWNEMQYYIRGIKP